RRWRTRIGRDPRARPVAHARTPGSESRAHRPAARTRRRSEKRLPAGSRCPFSNDLAPLPRANGQDGKTVDRCVQPEEVLQHTREEVRAPALKFLLVHLELDAPATSEAGAVLADDARIVR